MAGIVFFRVASWLLVAVGSVLLLRLAVTLAATPEDLWTIEFAPLTVAEAPAAVATLPARAQNWISDPAIARSFIGGCVNTIASPADARGCRAAVEYGLRASPASSELWLARARLLVAEGIVDARLVESLRASFVLAPRELWIAAERLPFALQVRSLLPLEMTADIGRDITQVVTSRRWAEPLVLAYIADPFLREATWDVIEQFATLDQQEQLIAWIRAEL